MGASEWIALAAVLMTWIGTAAAVYAKLCVMASQIETLSRNIRRLWELWDTRPCDTHTAEIASLKEQIKSLEARLE